MTPAVPAPITGAPSAARGKTEYVWIISMVEAVGGHDFAETEMRIVEATVAQNEIRNLPETKQKTLEAIEREMARETS